MRRSMGSCASIASVGLCIGSVGTSLSLAHVPTILWPADPEEQKEVSPRSVYQSVGESVGESVAGMSQSASQDLNAYRVYFKATSGDIRAISRWRTAAAGAGNVTCSSCKSFASYGMVIRSSLFSPSHHLQNQ
jgi:hypothetical protein